MDTASRFKHPWVPQPQSQTIKDQTIAKLHTFCDLNLDYNTSARKEVTENTYVFPFVEK